MKKGFTLIELLVVLIIIGIATAIAMPSYTGAIERSKNKSAMVTLRALWDAINMYSLKYNTVDSCNNAGTPTCAGVADCNNKYGLNLSTQPNCDWLYWVNSVATGVPGFYAQRNISSTNNRYRLFSGSYKGGMVSPSLVGTVRCDNGSGGPNQYCDFSSKSL